MTTVRYGIIGTGGMAGAHAKALAPIDGVELAACLDINLERCQAYAKSLVYAPATTEMDDLLGRCDAVSIVTPDAYHAPLSLEVLKSGTHLLCEKPLTTNLPDAVEVAQAAVTAAEQHGTIHMVNFSYRNAAAFQHARKLVASGELGTVRHVTGRYFQAWLACDVWQNWTGESWLWRIKTPKDGSAASGGVLGDVGCHILDFATGVAGDASAVRCRMRTFPKIHPETGEPVESWEGDPLDANDSVVIELDFNDGGLGSLESSRWISGHPNQVALGVYGTEGGLEIDLEQSYTRVRTCIGDDRLKSKWTDHELEETPDNYQRFITSIQTGKNDQADIVRGAHIQAYLDACERSAINDGALTELLPWK